MKEPCIYIFTSPSGASYTGQTVNLKRRLATHFYQVRIGSKTPFHCAIRKYGFDLFSYALFYCKESELDLFERLLIGIFKGIGIVYNCTEGGAGSRGWHPTKETLELFSKLRKGHRGWNLGKKIHSLEDLKNMSERAKGSKNPFYKKKHSEETKQKIRESNQKRIWTHESREKMSVTKKAEWLKRKHVKG